VGYARPGRIENLVRECIGLGIREIYIAIDGQKRPDVKMNGVFDEMRQRLSGLDVDIQYWFRDTNLATPVSVISAIDWFFLNVSQGIILEDDIEISNNFLIFVEFYLKKYRDEGKVWLISGSQPFPQNTSNSVISNYPLIWGWATWADRWKVIRAHVLSNEFRITKGVKPSVQGFWAASFYRATRGKVQSWAMPLAAQMRMNSFIGILPAKNLVTNNGADNQAVHTTEDVWPLNLPIDTDMLTCSESTLNQPFSEFSVDELLEKELFRVKKRHALYLLYFVALRIKRNPKSNQLLERLGRVQIPKVK
jgi:GR25 family glycosyltransferase involved in LPS biosynthesis